MTVSRLTLFLLALMAGESLASDDWIGLDEDPGFILSADLAVDDSGDLNGGFNLELPLGDNTGINGSFRVYELSDEDEDFQSLALATVLWFQLTELVDIELNYFFEGNIDELEKETLGMAMGFNRGDWRFQLQFEEGDLQQFTRGDLGDVISRVIPEQIDSDVAGYGVSVSWQQQDWYWQAIHQRFDYERDLSSLNRSDFVQFVVKSAALAQNSLLISKYSALLIGFTDTADDYWLQLAQDQSAIDDLYTDTLILNWHHWTSSNLGYLVAASFPESEDAELVLGIRWLM